MEIDGLGDADSSGSTFVKYRELLAEMCQSGAASSFSTLCQWINAPKFVRRYRIFRG